MCSLAISAEMFARQNCATILLHRQSAQSTAARCKRISGASAGSLNFKCKSCDRAFETFQALGGHRASHKKLRLTGDSETDRKSGCSGGEPVVKLKVHECNECRIRFPTGQALGGHMRKHVDLLAKRKRVEEDYIKNVLEGDQDKLKLSKRVVLQFDLNSPPPLEDY